MNEYQNDNFYDNNGQPRRIHGRRPNLFIQDEVQQFGNSDFGQSFSQDGTPMVKFKPRHEDEVTDWSRYEDGHDAYTPQRAGYQEFPQELRVQRKAPQHAATQPRQAMREINHGLSRNVLILIGSGFALLVVALVLVLTMGGGANNNDVKMVTQPATSAQVAAEMGCTGFSDESIGQSGMVVTAGSCTKDGTKYAIDTFVTTAVRDQWLKAAEPLGVNPKWETATSVTYKSVTK